MWTYLVSFLLALFIGWDLAKLVNNHPTAWYLGAVAIDALVVLGVALGWSGGFWNFCYAILGKGQLAFFLFCVVMFTGCFKLKSKPRMKLKQVRQPLALLTVILTLGHVAAAIMERGLGWFSIGFGVTCILLGLLLAVLGVTSILKVQDHMKAEVLDRIQNLAYVFFGLLCVHAAWMHVVWGSYGPAILYALTLALYVYTRLRRRRLQRRGE